MGNKNSNVLKQSNVQEKYKVIFLDVDGVLNNANSSIENLYIVEPELILILKKIIVSSSITNTCIVLSSTWRYTAETRDIIEKSLKDQGLGNHIKSCTPYYSGTNRVYEIVSWLENNTNYDVLNKYSLELPVLKHNENSGGFLESLTRMPDNKKLNIDSIVILDDMDLIDEIKGLGQSQTENFAKFLNDHFVHVTKRLGLTENDAKLASAILNKNKA